MNVMLKLLVLGLVAATMASCNPTTQRVNASGVAFPTDDTTTTDPDDTTTTPAPIVGAFAANPCSVSQTVHAPTLSCYNEITPAATEPLQATDIVQVGESICAIEQTTQALKCWGHRETPVPPAMIDVQLTTKTTRIPSDVTNAALDSEGGCAVVNGDVQCWGDNIGTSLQTSEEPQTALFADFTKVSLGGEQRCAAGTTGVWCWGPNTWKETIGEVVVDNLLPHRILPGIATSIAVSPVSACAVVAGALYCWGGNSYGQIGDTTYVDSDVPVLILASGVKSVVAGPAASDGFCAQLSSNDLHCWGGTKTQYPATPFAPRRVHIANGHSIQLHQVLGGHVYFTDNGFSSMLRLPNYSSGSSYFYNPLSAGPQASKFTAQTSTLGMCYLSTNHEIYCAGSFIPGMNEFILSNTFQNNIWLVHED